MIGSWTYEQEDPRKTLLRSDMNGCTVQKRGQDSRVGKGKQGDPVHFPRWKPLVGSFVLLRQDLTL